MADEREVNFSEIVKIDVPDSEPIDDANSEMEKETPEDSSPQEEPAEESIEEPEKVEEIETSETPREPKAVEGETNRERALRLEATRLKRELRAERTRKTFEGYTPEMKSELSSDEQAVLGQYDQQELTQFERVVDVIAKKKGWVNKVDFQTQTYQQQAADTLDNWLENHKEYLPENDKDNILWGNFQRELSIYKKPENPRDLKRIFDKVHREVFGISEGVNDSKINAQREKVKIASHSGANQKSQIRPQQSYIDSSLKEHLKGFTEEEKNEILG